jgi:hypothetical protein
MEEKKKNHETSVFKPGYFTKNKDIIIQANGRRLLGREADSTLSGILS